LFRFAATVLLDCVSKRTKSGVKAAWLFLLGFLLLATRAAAQDEFDYMTNADGVTLTITNYTGAGGDVTIPTNINGRRLHASGRMRSIALTV
jgi:hypothetical protein